MVNVSTFDGLVRALRGGAAAIQLASGTYSVTATLMIARNVTIKAAPSATVVLDAQHQRRVLQIDGGTVVLERVSITGGHVRSLCAQPLCAYRGVQTEEHSLYDPKLEMEGSLSTAIDGTIWPKK